MDMDEFWNRYIKREGTAEDKMNQLTELGLDQFIDPNQVEEFYSYLNRIMTSFVFNARGRILTAYKQGRKVGGYNMLNPNQKKMIKQEKYSAYVDIEPTDDNWDPEGFNESFQGNSDSDSVEDELINLERADKDKK